MQGYLEFIKACNSEKTTTNWFKQPCLRLYFRNSGNSGQAWSRFLLTSVECFRRATWLTLDK